MTSISNERAEYRDGHGFIAEIIRTDCRKTADLRVEGGVHVYRQSLGETPALFACN